MAKVLTFNLDARQKVLLQHVAAVVEVEMIEVIPDLFDTRISEILNSMDCNSISSVRFPSFADEMLVFDGFSDDKLYEFLHAMKENGVRHIPLKATVTEYNKNWTPVALSLELKRENEEMAKYVKK